MGIKQILKQQPFVTVLLATYNGEKYLVEQLESLERQIGVSVNVVVNDDGSNDGTLDILKEFEKRGLVTRVSSSNKIGSSASFLSLLASELGSEYVALCDQDDIWDDDKLISGINEIRSEEPTIVISNRRYINSFGLVCGHSPKIRKKLDYRNAFIENVAYGNTILMNNASLRLVISIVPKNVVIDHWIYLVHSVSGNIIHIPRSLISYRIHGGNEIGVSKNFTIKNFAKNNRYRREQVATLVEEFSERLSPEVLSAGKAFLAAFDEKNPVKNLLLLRRSRIQRQHAVETILYRLYFLLVVIKPNIRVRK